MPKGLQLYSETDIRDIRLRLNQRRFLLRARLTLGEDITGRPQLRQRPLRIPLLRLTHRTFRRRKDIRRSFRHRPRHRTINRRRRTTRLTLRTTNLIRSTRIPMHRRRSHNNSISIIMHRRRNHSNSISIIMHRRNRTNNSTHTPRRRRNRNPFNREFRRINRRHRRPLRRKFPPIATKE